MGIIFICWSVIGSVMLDQTVVPITWRIPYIGFLVLFVPIIVFVAVWKGYWEK
jgi:hypothetical protein